MNLDCVILNNNPFYNINELKLPNLRGLYIEGIQTEDWTFLLTNFPALEYVLMSDERMTASSKKSMKEIIKKKDFYSGLFEKW